MTAAGLTCRSEEYHVAFGGHRRLMLPSREQLQDGGIRGVFHTWRRVETGTGMHFKKAHLEWGMWMVVTGCGWLAGI